MINLRFKEVYDFPDGNLALLQRGRQIGMGSTERTRMETFTYAG
jgi:hypothetical protein